MIRLLLLLMIMLSTGTARATIDYQFDSAKMESEYNQLINELRCLVCQNQNLAGSNADLARDLRRETYEMLKDGKSPEQVIEFMVARYGEFVLYRPRFKPSTYLLWLGPFFLLLLVLFLILRRFRKSDAAVQVDSRSLEQAQHLLEDEEPRP